MYTSHLQLFYRPPFHLGNRHPDQPMSAVQKVIFCGDTADAILQYLFPATVADSGGRSYRRAPTFRSLNTPSVVLRSFRGRWSVTTRPWTRSSRLRAPIRTSNASASRTYVRTPFRRPAAPRGRGEPARGTRAAVVEDHLSRGCAEGRCLSRAYCAGCRSRVSSLVRRGSAQPWPAQSSTMVFP